MWTQFANCKVLQTISILVMAAFIMLIDVSTCHSHVITKQYSNNYAGD